MILDVTSFSADSSVSSINIKILQSQIKEDESTNTKQKVKDTPLSESVSQSGVLEKVEAKLLSTLKPVYPLVSRIKREEGSVEINLKVNQEGKAFDIFVAKSSGHLRLDQAALNAVKEATFSNESKEIANLNLNLNFKMK